MGEQSVGDQGAYESGELMAKMRQLGLYGEIQTRYCHGSSGEVASRPNDVLMGEEEYQTPPLPPLVNSLYGKPIHMYIHTTRIKPRVS